jgi:hypothetical protein
MTQFTEICWLDVVTNFDRNGTKIEVSPDSVKFYSYPYGNIHIHDNGGEVNVWWSNIPGLNVNLPEEHVMIWEYKLFYSLPIINNSNEMATLIKKSLDKAIEKALAEKPLLYLPITENQSQEVRVIQDQNSGNYIVQTLEPRKNWQNTSEWKSLKSAIDSAMSLHSIK